MDPTEPDLYDMAAAHFARLEAGLANAAERAEIERWCALSPRHRAAFEAMASGWELAGAAHEEPSLKAMLAGLGDRYPASGTPPAAQAIATPDWATDEDPHEDDAAPQARAWPRWAPVALAATLAALLAVPAGWWLAQPGRNNGSALSPRLAVEEAVFESPVNARRDVRLPDGSRLTLDRDSRVAIAFASDVRGLTLERGRAFFAVRKNKARPFVVNAGSLTATAVGTAFAVSVIGAERKVTTTEGLVRVDTRGTLADGSHRAMVGAGMSLRQSGSQVTLAPIEAEQATAWREGRIVFSRRCLGSVVAEMNQYGALHLALEPGAARIAVSGVFDLDRAQSLTDALEAQGLVRVSARTADTRTLARGASADDTACQP